VSSTRTGDTATKPSGGGGLVGGGDVGVVVVGGPVVAVVVVGGDTVTGTLGVSGSDSRSTAMLAVTSAFVMAAVETTGISMRSGSVGRLLSGGTGHHSGISPGNCVPTKDTM
jgi:hypothetical protein